MAEKRADILLDIEMSRFQLCDALEELRNRPPTTAEKAAIEGMIRGPVMGLAKAIGMVARSNRSKRQQVSPASPRSLTAVIADYNRLASELLAVQRMIGDLARLKGPPSGWILALAIAQEIGDLDAYFLPDGPVERRIETLFFHLWLELEDLSPDEQQLARGAVVEGVRDVVEAMKGWK